MTDQKPLKGKRIVVTRSPEQAEALGEKLAALGAVPILFPAIRFTPLPAPELDEALNNLPDYDWLIFTSGNAVRFFWERLASAELDIAPHYSLRIAAVGSATSRLLGEKGIGVDFVPEEFTAEKLALGLGDLTGKKVLLPRAKIGRPEIINLLQEQGAIVTDIGLYDTITAEPAPEALAELEQGVDVITFTSPSSVRNFLNIVERFGKPLYSPVIACIGPSTAAEAEAYGLSVDVVPEDYTIDGLIWAVADYYTTHSRHSERVNPKPYKHE